MKKDYFKIGFNLTLGSLFAITTSKVVGVLALKVLGLDGKKEDKE